MDEIVQQFQYTLGEERAEANSPHRAMYKHRGKYENQDQRRSEILRRQKSNRQNHLDNYRGLYNLVESSDDGGGLFGEYSEASYQPRFNVPGFTQNDYKNILMLSEWLIEKPADFSRKWFVVPCPVGTRVLVVANNGKTRLYTKYGVLYDTILSRLPGGHGVGKRKDDTSVLDGIYCRDLHTIYVLDVLFWRNHIMAEGEMEFRRFWLEGKFSEHPEYSRTNKKYKVSLKLLPIARCDVLSLQDFMLTYPPLPEARLDGLLFYHKGGSYISGQTPLVGWLYPYMVPEILYRGMLMHESYAAMKPPDYIDQDTFIEKFDEKYKRKNSIFTRWRKSYEPTYDASMGIQDVSAVPTNDDIAAFSVDETLTSESGFEPITNTIAYDEYNANQLLYDENALGNFGHDENAVPALEYAASEVYPTTESYTYPQPAQYVANEPCCQYCCNYTLSQAISNQYQPYEPLNLYDSGNQDYNEAIEENVREFFAHFER